MKATSATFLQDPSAPWERIPHPVRVQIPQLLRGVYQHVDEIMNEHPLLSEFGHGGLAHGILKYIVANNTFCKAVASGFLPGRALMRPTENGSGEYMEYVYDRVGVTLSRTHNPWDVPRASSFRVNAAYNNQSLFQFAMPECTNPESPVDASLVLVHGNHNLTFARLLLCSVEDGKLIALHKSPNLLTYSDQAAHVPDIVAEDEIEELIVKLRDEYRGDQTATGS